ncbi:MAG: chemotaxis-specific protein-glutamate methyltransferase CheB [Candidatus Krumholzibacteriota bacterium]|nr:chemotaxis-specific protein-glutamate methyltransferase CheB [Candidatus Krumholzibacteriota bacterium]
MAIKVLCADDSKQVLVTLARLLSSDPEVEVIGQAEDGEQAVRNVKNFAPDVITLDLKMPKLDGLQALKRIRMISAAPVIMISSFTQPGALAALEALELGAYGFIPKPVSGRMEDMIKMSDELIRLIKEADQAAKQQRHNYPPGIITRNTGYGSADPESKFNGNLSPAVYSQLSTDEIDSFRAIAIGCSSGGPITLLKILPLLPESFPWPIIIVQHMPKYFTAYFAENLDRKCSLRVKEAVSGERARKGCVYLAPGGYHVKVAKAGEELKFVFDGEIDPVFGACPSVDVLMESVAARVGKKAVGILLSGMGMDGVEGLLKMKQAGAVTVVQDRASALIYGMPGRALESGAADQVVCPQDIPNFIYHSARMRALEKKADSSSPTLS